MLEDIGLWPNFFDLVSLESTMDLFFMHSSKAGYDISECRRRTLSGSLTTSKLEVSMPDSLFHDLMLSSSSSTIILYIMIYMHIWCQKLSIGTTNASDLHYISCAWRTLNTRSMPFDVNQMVVLYSLCLPLGVQFEFGTDFQKYKQKWVRKCE